MHVSITIGSKKMLVRIKKYIKSLETEINQKLSLKQDVLKAGENITIDGNEVSSPDVVTMENAKSVLLDMFYPVGIFIGFENETDPNELFGGTWERYAEGKFIFGVNKEDSDFSKAGKTGGEKDHVLTINEMPKHSFEVSGKTNDASIIVGNSNGDVHFQTTGTGWGVKSATHNHSFTATTNSVGGGTSHNNMPPYVTAYYWKRTK